LGFERKVVFIIASERTRQVDAEHDELVVAGTTEYLYGIGGSVGSQTPGQVDGIAHASGAVRQVIARIPYFSCHRNDRRVLEIEAREDTHRIERLQRDRLFLRA